MTEARIISLSNPQDDANSALHKGMEDPSTLPKGASLLAIGTKLEDFDIETLKTQQPNVVFVSAPGAREPLAQLLQTLPSIEWVHTRSAGIDFCTSETLASSSVKMTNAKGKFSSTLAEYTMMACSYFAKDLPRLMQQKSNCDWNQYEVLELRGATLGIIGYGDIGHACAKLADAYGMNIIGLSRRKKQTVDPYASRMYYGNTPENLCQIFQQSDYILVAAPLTPETQGMIGKNEFDNAKKGAVIINLGRGPIIDEDAMIDALKDGRLKGAALDVVTKEPLPVESDLWKLENVLLSPHNMDKTATFMHESTTFFVEENLPRFLRGDALLNSVDKVAGY